jgi:hypothetical protein
MSLESPVQRDGDNGFIGFASRLNPLTLPAGMLQDSVNMRLDRGVAQTRKGSKRLTDTIGTTGAPLVLNFTLGSDKTATSITRSGTTATATVTAHGFPNESQINIRGATDPLYNGDFVITVVDANSFTYAMAGSPASNASGTIVANNGPEVRDSYSGGLYAAGVFASHTYNNGAEWIALAGQSSATLWRDGQSAVVKTYPTSPSETIEATDVVSIVQALNRLYILRDADPTVTGWGTKTTNSSGIAVSGTTATVHFASDHGYPAGARVRIEGSTTPAFEGHEYNIEDNAPGGNAARFTITVPSGTPTHAAAGIRIRRVKPPIYWDGGSGNFVRAVAGVPAEGVTYTRMPSCGFASYINNRLWLAKGEGTFIESAAVSGIRAKRRRKLNTISVSDVLDADLYDPFWNSFRVDSGGSDYIVAIHPWIEGQVLIFCRKSIYLATLNQVASTDGSDFSVDTPVSEVQLLTNEIGCSARNTICTAGQYVFFLSDAGIYRLDARLDLKLRGDTRPLSEPIADLFDSVVQSRVEDDAFAVWHNNRYVVALPTSADPLDGNQLVICWNALTEAWEYRDIYPSSSSVNTLIVGTYDDKRRVFSVPRSGNLYLLEQQTNGTDDNAAGSVNDNNPITGAIKTRRYDFGDMHSKRFLRTIADVVLPLNSTVKTKINSINPDLPPDQNDSEPITGYKIGELTNSANDNPEDYNMKSPIRYKAHAMEIIYTTSGGRPEIRSASIEASPKSLPPTETRSAT